MAFATAGLAIAAARIELPPGPNRDLVYSRCRTCHDLQYVVESAGITPGNWAALIDGMRQYGLRIPADEREKIVQYLSTYLGPHPPPAAAGSTQAGGEAATANAPIDGKAVYARQCSACHQTDGTGISGTFPPLAGNPDLFRDRLLPVFVVLNGIQGPLTVKGEQYRGAMPPFDHLSDAEIAAVVTYVRGAWNNAALRPPQYTGVDAAAVRAARGTPMSANDVHAYRAAKH
jgi:mono/diheme cytochrome c family protein